MKYDTSWQNHFPRVWEVNYEKTFVNLLSSLYWKTFLRQDVKNAYINEMKKSFYNMFFGINIFH